MEKSDFDSRMYIVMKDIIFFIKHKKLNLIYIKEIGWFQGIHPRFGIMEEIYQDLDEKMKLKYDELVAKKRSTLKSLRRNTLLLTFFKGKC